MTMGIVTQKPHFCYRQGRKIGRVTMVTMVSYLFNKRKKGERGGA
jgi:hypothetical protein